MKKVKRLNKKILMAVAVIALAAAALTAAFFLKKKKGNDIYPVNYCMFSYWVNSKGMFLFEDGLLYYYDPSNGKKYVACNKSGCDHDDDSCPAYSENTITGATFTKKGLMYLETDNKNTLNMCLYSVDLDGKNKTKLHTFRNIFSVWDVNYADDGVYVSYSKRIDKKGNRLDKTISGIIYYNIKKAKEKNIVRMEEPGFGIEKFTVFNGTVYYNCNYTDLTYKETKKHRNDADYMRAHTHLELIKCNANGKTEVICDDLNYIYAIPVFKNYLIYADTRATYAYDTNTGKSKKIADESLEPVQNEENDKVLLISRRNKKLSYCLISKKLDNIKKIKCSVYCMCYMKDYVYGMNNKGNIVYETKADFLGGKDHFKEFK